MSWPVGIGAEEIAWRAAEVSFESGTVRFADGEAGPPYLLPGLVDVHCHGVEGLDVMDGSGAEIASRLRKRGIEWVCLTTVTASWADIANAVSSVPFESPGVAGFHIEGPWLNPVRKGAQKPEFMSSPNVSDMEAALGSDLGRVRIVTLAPELPGAMEAIRWLTARGIAPSAGHTDAEFEVMRDAEQAGLSRLTHFYNAMRPFHHRDAGVVGFGLSSSATCELIYDREHVSPTAARLLWLAKCPDKMIAVSDGTRLSGMEEGTEMELWGASAKKVGNAARLSDGSLSGSACTLAEVFSNLWNDLSPAAAVAACIENPRAELGLPDPRLWIVVNGSGMITDVIEGSLTVSPA